MSSVFLRSPHFSSPPASTDLKCRRMHLDQTKAKYTGSSVRISLLLFQTVTQFAADCNSENLYFTEKVCGGNNPKPEPEHHLAKLSVSHCIYYVNLNSISVGLLMQHNEIVKDIVCAFPASLCQGALHFC